MFIDRLKGKVLNLFEITNNLYRKDIFKNFEVVCEMGRSDSGEENINFRDFKLFKAFVCRLIIKKNDITYNI